MTSAQHHAGSCLCGSVRYVIEGPLQDVVACHCSQCRKTSGHFAAMTQVGAAALSLESSQTLAWYRSSEFAERGFCSRCGSNLFWREVASTTISITAGTLDAPTCLKIGKHIYTADKADYYSIDGDAPQMAQG